MKFDPDDVWVNGIKGLTRFPQQDKRRLYRVAIVCAVGISYLLDTLLLFLFSLAGTISFTTPLYYGLAGLGHVALFSLLHWSGFSDRFQNRHMTIWQMAYGISAQLLGITLAPQIASFFFALMFVIFSFGTLRIRIHEALATWFLSMLAIALTISLNSDARLMLFQPSTTEYLLITVSFALILLRSIVLGYYGMTLRQQIYELSRSLEIKANQDDLTGLYNRRALNTILEEQLNLHARRSIPCSLAMLDIDHFKSINDSFGHAVGDAILQALVKQLKRQIRSSDKLIRYGGEEFILVMTATELEEAEILSERIRQQIGLMRWNQLTDKRSLTISIGLTQVLDGDQPRDLLKRADLALYHAKRSGRNRVVVFRSELLQATQQAYTL
jgi:diguanylate cyclase (GGDEF)-like protein